MARISIHERSVGDVVILAPHGAPRICDKIGLRDRIVELIGRGATRFVVDLERTWGWGSLFVGELVACQILCQQNSCSMKLLKPPKGFGAILAVSKLDSAFERYEAEEAAIRSFSEESAAQMVA